MLRWLLAVTLALGLLLASALGRAAADPIGDAPPDIDIYYSPG